uniref:Uncharacterized protein n=1 Tax=Eutreptiella gymnastica TaxID=73025 RepID=A0A7S1NNQ5_9EUGL|mmetsp:Transcript_57823/g.103229  ORF Transcript_57823/g.103229 Transcript_57823/m.103229 type:complete len:120 (+) Transcript_57823:436-795(+)
MPPQISDVLVHLDTLDFGDGQWSGVWGGRYRYNRSESMCLQDKKWSIMSAPYLAVCVHLKQTFTGTPQIRKVESMDAPQNRSGPQETNTHTPKVVIYYNVALLLLLKAGGLWSLLFFAP